MAVIRSTRTTLPTEDVDGSPHEPCEQPKLGSKVGKRGTRTIKGREQASTLGI